MLLAVFLKLFIRSHQSSLGLFSASHFIVFPHAYLYTRRVCLCGASITVCVYLWESVEVVFDLPPPHYGAYIIQQNIYYCLCLSQSWICLVHNESFLLFNFCLSQLVLAESAHSDGGSQCTESHPELPPPLERTGGIGDSRPPSFQ